MPTSLQFRRGNTATAASVTGANGELYINTDTHQVIVHDGATAGGFALQTSAGMTSNVATRTANNTSFVGSISAANVVSNAQLQSALAGYQVSLVSGTNIKTLNGVTLLGSGDIVISGGDNLSAAAEDILPVFNNVYNIGNTSNRWYDLFIGNSINLNGTSIRGNSAGVVIPTVLAGNLLVSNNLITPDSTTARQYLGSQGVVAINGNLDVTGDWAKMPIVGTTYGVGAWSAGGSMNNARYGAVGCGLQNAALVVSGYSTTLGGTILTTEEYNGSTWNTTNTIGAHVWRGAGCGSQNAALAFGNDAASTASYAYNGDAWSTTASMNSYGGGRATPAGCGVQDAALAINGYNSSYGYLTTTELYNGVVWGTNAPTSIPRTYGMAAGTAGAGLVFGGVINSAPTSTATSEEFNGISWSTGGTMVTGARNTGAGAGMQSAALVMGGQINNGRTISAEEYNGTAWSVAPSLNTLIYANCGAGTQNAALSYGGFNASNASTAGSEQYNKAALSTVTANGTMGAVRFNRNIGKFEGYDGSQWTSFY